MLVYQLKLFERVQVDSEELAISHIDRDRLLAFGFIGERSITLPKGQLIKHDKGEIVFQGYKGNRCRIGFRYPREVPIRRSSSL